MPKLTPGYMMLVSPRWSKICIWVKKLGILDVMILLPREDEQGKEDGGCGVAPREAPVLPNLLSKLSFAFFDFLAS